MAKYIVRPGQRVTHGSEQDAREHYSKMQPGQSFAAFPPPPVLDYFEGDEIDLTEEQADAMPHAVCTPDEFDAECSPTAFVKKGYSKGEAEDKAQALRESIAARKAARASQKKKSAIPSAPTSPSGETPKK
jgi:hypothetical protein